MGNQPAVTAMKQVAEGRGAARRRQQMDYKGMEDVDDGVYVYGGDEETITNTASNVCVPCSADDEAMDEVSRSRLTSRAGWTDEEHAVGHVLVGGDGSVTSQVPMEVVHKRVGRGNRKKNTVKSPSEQKRRWSKSR